MEHKLLPGLNEEKGRNAEMRDNTTGERSTLEKSTENALQQHNRSDVGKEMHMQNRDSKQEMTAILDISEGKLNELKMLENSRDRSANLLPQDSYINGTFHLENTNSLD